MAHPVHDILKRIFDAERVTFDTNIREIWPSERFVQAFTGDRADETPDPGQTEGVYLEREPES